jgi:hypothetical protein
LAIEKAALGFAGRKVILVYARYMAGSINELLARDIQDMKRNCNPGQAAAEDLNS